MSTPSGQQEDLKNSIKIRNATQDDVNFIFSTWQKTYRHSVKTAGIPSEVYYSQQHVLIEGLMKTACIIIACDPKDQSQIYGYLCYDTIEGAPVVHFAYVKKAYRALGIAKLMLNNSTVDIKLPFFITHHTAPISRISTEKYVLVYNPYLAYPAYQAGRDQAKEYLSAKVDT